MRLQKEGALVFDKRNLTFAETWENMRGARGLKEKYGVLKTWLESGSWDVEVDERVGRIDFLIGDYNDNFVHFYALRMFKQLWMSVTLAATTGAPNVLFIFLGQLMELLLQFTYSPFNDKIHNITELLSMLCNSITVLSVGMSALSIVTIDDTVLLLISTVGTLVAALGSLSVGSLISSWSSLSTLCGWKIKVIPLQEPPTQGSEFHGMAKARQVGKQVAVQSLNNVSAAKDAVGSLDEEEDGQADRAGQGEIGSGSGWVPTHNQTNSDHQHIDGDFQNRRTPRGETHPDPHAHMHTKTHAYTHAPAHARTPPGVLHHASSSAERQLLIETHEHNLHAESQGHAMEQRKAEADLQRRLRERKEHRQEQITQIYAMLDGKMAENETRDAQAKVHNMMQEHVQDAHQDHEGLQQLHAVRDALTQAQQ